MVPRRVQHSQALLPLGVVTGVNLQRVLKCWSSSVRTWSLVCTVVYFPNPACSPACWRALGERESASHVGGGGAVGDSAGWRERARRWCFHGASCGRSCGAAEATLPLGARSRAVAHSRGRRGTDHLPQHRSGIRAARAVSKGQTSEVFPERGTRVTPVAPACTLAPHPRIGRPRTGVGGHTLRLQAAAKRVRFPVPQATGTSPTSVGT